MNVVKHHVHLHIIIQLMVTILENHYLPVLCRRIFHKLFSLFMWLDEVHASQTHKQRVVELKRVPFGFFSQLIELLEHFQCNVLVIEDSSDVFLDFDRIIGQGCRINFVVDKNVVKEGG